MQLSRANFGSGILDGVEHGVWLAFLAVLALYMFLESGDPVEIAGYSYYSTRLFIMTNTETRDEIITSGVGSQAAFPS